MKKIHNLTNILVTILMIAACILNISATIKTDVNIYNIIWNVVTSILITLIVIEICLVNTDEDIMSITIEKNNKCTRFSSIIGIQIIIGIIALCSIVTNARKIEQYNDKKALNKEMIKAYDRYYNKVETLLDSLGVEGDVMLETDTGCDYLDAKGTVDSIAYHKYQ